MRDVAFADQRTVTDDEFLDHLRLPGVFGRRLAAARTRGDRPAIVGAVADHYRTRRGPRWPFYMHGSPWMEINGRGETMEKADALLSDRFRSSWPPFQQVDLSKPGGGIDWKKGQDQVYGSLSRCTGVAELSTAFALTGDVRYIAKARDLIRAFVTENPFVLEEGFFEDHDRYFGGGFDNSGDVYSRSKRWVDLMHCGALHVPGVFSDEDVFWLIKQLWFYAMQYYRLVGDVLRRDNHHLTDHGGAAFFYGVMFPEFTVAKEMRAEGMRVVRHHVTANLLDDGCYAEHCTRYQYHITYMIFAPYALAKANGIPLLNAKQERLFAQWMEFVANACKPDGIQVEFGDEFGGSLAQLFCINATPAMTPRLAAMARALGYEPGKLSYQTPAELGKSFAKWQAGTAPRIGLSPWFTHGRKAAAPAKSALPDGTVRYPQGGFSFFRSSWDAKADYLAVAHYADSLPHSHTHWDMMSFVLHTQGQTLIGDPATWLYTDERSFDPDTARDNRGYLYSVDAHNCLVMNDDTLKPLKALGHGCCWGGFPPKHGAGLFEAGGAIEVDELWHDAYAPTRHRRFVIHLRGIGFAFVDLLGRTGLDLRPHQYSQRFHCEGDVELSATSAAAGDPLRVARAGASAVLVPGGDAATAWKSWQDRRLDGLYGVPAARVSGGPWVAELTRRIQGPSVFTTFLLTHGAQGLGSLPRARYLGTKPAKWEYQQHEGFSANSLDLGEHGRVVIASCPYGKAVDHGEISTDAELAVAVLDRRGKLASWAMARGARLSVAGNRVASGRRRDWQSG
jgi:hypothetical protein